jgi:hypothetical protein
MQKVTPLYTKYYFSYLYTQLLRTETHFITDGTNTVWHIDDVENILMSNYGCSPADLYTIGALTLERKLG